MDGFCRRAQAADTTLQCEIRRHPAAKMAPFRRDIRMQFGNSSVKVYDEIYQVSLCNVKVGLVVLINTKLLPCIVISHLPSPEPK